MSSKIKMAFDTKIAKIVGTDAAIILSNIEFWVFKNQANEHHFYDDDYWTYNSIKAFEKMFDYLSSGQIRTCLDKLEKQGFLKSGNYNETKYDRTKWYSLGSSFYEITSENNHLLKSTNAFVEIDKCIYSNQQMDLLKPVNGFVEINKPIPDNKPDNKPNNKPFKENQEILNGNRNENFGNELLENDNWKESILIQNEFSKKGWGFQQLEIFIRNFNVKLNSELDIKNSKKDYASHFSRWLSGEIKNQEKIKIQNSNGTHPTMSRRIS